MFLDYNVNSSRILRDNQGQSRGVGFARYVTSPDLSRDALTVFTASRAVTSAKRSSESTTVSQLETKASFSRSAMQILLLKKSSSV